MEKKLYLYKVEAGNENGGYNGNMILPHPMDFYKLTVKNPLTGFYDRNSLTLYVNEDYVHNDLIEPFAKEAQDMVWYAIKHVQLFNHSNYKKYYSKDMVVIRGVADLNVDNAKEYNEDDIDMFTMGPCQKAGEVECDSKGNLFVEGEVLDFSSLIPDVSYFLNNNERYCPYEDGTIAAFICGYKSYIKVYDYELVKQISDETHIRIIEENDWMYENTPKNIMRYIDII